MAEETNPPTNDDKGGVLSVGELRKFITETVQSVVGSVGKAHDDAQGAAQEHTQTSLDRKGAIAAEVQAEIEKLKRREARAARDKEIDDKLADLSKKTEVHPVERSRVHRFMGWGE